MYEALIEWLRTHAKSYEEMFGEGESSIMMRQAADAIDELSKRLNCVTAERDVAMKNLCERR